MRKVNPNGGAIALGHPIGASGAVLATKALYELQRVNGKYALEGGHCAAPRQFVGLSI